MGPAAPPAGSAGFPAPGRGRQPCATAGADIAIVGGSVAGCAAALAAHRAGAGRITVFERAAGQLADRGVGLAVHDDRYAELAAAGYLDAAMPCVRLTTRRWYVRDGRAPFGREIAALPFPFRSSCWGPLWRELRRRLPADVTFRAGTTVREVAATADGATLRCEGEADTRRYDLVIGADGYRSVVRQAAFPGVRPAYAGYLAWRGAVPCELLGTLDLPGLPPSGWAEEDCVYAVFPGGHVIIYRIPDGRGGHRANWVLYTTPPPGLGLHLDTPTSLPPGTLSDALHTHLDQVADELLPPYWGGLIRLTPPAERFIQPLYDFTAPDYVSGRLLLAGDAATVARPHTGAGAVKALQDAAALERVLCTVRERPGSPAAYGSGRGAAGRSMVELGRRLGRWLVLWRHRTGRRWTGKRWHGSGPRPTPRGPSAEANSVPENAS
ncbi:FAD-dependent monooxygenase [Streptomyces pinistramenti]|uniref:FAD-dependent monooxygenase n=1 Tax=Streptomyces pinistramenti TaxID=2884812 RepID=UPI001D08E043|nr:FAD-dependent monooxygenase [Streptomyces pinistramenti]MCB5905964.1 FAD-dependent monooxygenase [Streptomyces pinistramenti]